MTDRHKTRKPSPTKPLDPKLFVERLATAIGTERAKILVKRAFDIVEQTGRPNAWIFEIKRARERGVLGPPVAHFLIYKLAESSMTLLTDTHPVLSRIGAELERIEREHGLQEGEYWHVHEGPPDWQALNREWDAVYDELLIDIFLRNGEREMAEACAAGDQSPLYDEGRALIFAIGPAADSGL